MKDVIGDYPPRECPTIVTEVAPFKDNAVFAAAKTAGADLHRVLKSRIIRKEGTVLPGVSVTEPIVNFQGATNSGEKGGAECSQEKVGVGDRRKAVKG